MNTIPDAWSIKEKFILLPVNKWDNEYKKVNIGGISCDQSDYYNSEDFNQEVLLPDFKKNDEEPLYLGFFHTGAYQDAISGFGGIKHCLIPSPKHIIVDEDEDGNLVDYVYRNEQTAEEMLKLLGYK
jgi:arginine decarboxylase